MQPWNTARRYHFSKLDTLSHVPRVVNPAPDVFNSYFVGQAAPIVFTDSPLFDSPMTLDDIVRQDRGKIRVNVRGSDYGNVKVPRQEQQMTLAEYVEKYARPSDGDHGSEGGKPTALCRQHAARARGIRSPRLPLSGMLRGKGV